MSVTTTDELVCDGCGKKITSDDIERKIGTWGEFNQEGYEKTDFCCPFCGFELTVNIELEWVEFHISIKKEAKN